MFSHGLIAGMSFLLGRAFYERAHTREISAFGGTVKVAPLLAGTLVFASFASMGLPGMSGFIGEFMVLVGSFEPFTVYAVARGARGRADRRLPAVDASARRVRPAQPGARRHAGHDAGPRRPRIMPLAVGTTVFVGSSRRRWSR